MIDDKIFRCLRDQTMHENERLGVRMHAASHGELPALIRHQVVVLDIHQGVSTAAYRTPSRSVDRLRRSTSISLCVPLASVAAHLLPIGDWLEHLAALWAAYHKEFLLRSLLQSLCFLHHDSANESRCAALGQGQDPSPVYPTK